MGLVNKIKDKLEKTRSEATTRREARIKNKEIRVKQQRDKRIKQKRETLQEVKLDRQLAQEKSKLQKTSGGGVPDLFSGSSGDNVGLFGEAPRRSKKSKKRDEPFI